MPKQPTIKERMEEQGWIFNEFYCLKKVDHGREIDIEFCIGDCCVGIYDESLSLLEPKIRCGNALMALVEATELEEKYKSII